MIGRSKILPKNYEPQDWAGNKVQVGDLVFLYRVYGIVFKYPRYIPYPDFDKPEWHLVCSFKVQPYKEGAEKLVLYLRDGYDPEKTYDVSINGNSLRDGCGSDLYVLCIDGKSNDRKAFEEHEAGLIMNKAIEDLMTNP